MFSRALGEGGEQSRLADPRLSSDQDDARTAGRARLEASPEEPEFSLPPDKLRVVGMSEHKHRSLRTIRQSVLALY
jgi:hypothetical protein